MKQIIGSMGLVALVLAGCSQARTNGKPGASTGTGDVEFELDLPNGDVLDSVSLTIMCPGFTQTHEVSLADGDEVAGFAGILPGDCTVSISGTTADGFSCSGSGAFSVMANTVAQEAVAVTCTGGDGVDGNRGGQVNIGTTVTVVENVCPAPRVLKLYAIPANLPAGGSTTVEVETQNTTDTVEVSFSTVDPANTGAATAADNDGTGCAAGSEDCALVTCSSGGVVYVSVTVSDSECTDTEQVSIECGGEVVEPICGDGEVNQPSEQCDGEAGLMDPAVQNCLTDCTLEAICGNGYTEGAEACDDGNIVDGDTCSADCSTVTAEPICGDGAVNQPSEQCDGTDGLTDPATQTCDENCQIQSIGDPPNACRDCIEDPAGVLYSVLGAEIMACQSSDSCSRALNCYTESFCANGATVSECYCGLGANPDTCVDGSVAPTGACMDLIVELAGAGLTAGDYITFMVNPANPMGQAYSLFDTAIQEPAGGCVDACDDAPVEPGTVGPF